MPHYEFETDKLAKALAFVAGAAAAHPPLSLWQGATGHADFAVIKPMRV